MRTALAWIIRLAYWLSTRFYGLYVVHLIMLEIASGAIFLHGWQPLKAVTLAVVVTPLLAELSWRLLERPILAFRPV